jgi:hypothetical protein
VQRPASVSPFLKLLRTRKVPRYVGLVPISRSRPDHLSHLLGKPPVSRLGHLVALTRLRKSVSSASGKLTWNGRIALASVR